MNLVRNLTVYIILTALLSFIPAALELNSQELPDSPKLEKFGNINNNLVSIEEMKNGTELISKLKRDKIQSLEYMLFDSLANGYSYFSNRQQPYVYHVATGTLVTIKRGAIDLEEQPTYQGENTLNNLFIRTSEDWGKTWTDPAITYNNDDFPGDMRARYPSIHPIIYDENLAFVYTSPLTGGEGWIGYVTGIYDGYGFNNISSNNDLNINGQDYGWGTDAKLVGGDVDGDPWVLAIGGVMPPDGSRNGDYSDNSNIAYRYTPDFSDWNYVIPEQWASDKFYPVTTDSNRSSVIVDLVEASDGKLYMGAFGNFVLAGDVQDRFKPALSVSEDKGMTWSEFDIAPFNLVRDYASNLGLNPDSVTLYVCHDMTVLDNGDISFISVFRDIAQLTPPLETINHVVEIFKEGQNDWAIRKIGDHSAYSLPYYDEVTGQYNANNQMSYELQISRTIDGTKLLAKWVDLTGLEDGANGPTFQSSDIFAATRVVGESEWSETIPLTDDAPYHRITWIPDFIPNNMVDIPLLEVITVPNPANSEDLERQRARNLLEPQYVMIAHFNAIVGVDDDNNDKPLEIKGLYPNPADGYADFNFMISRNGNTTVELYDVLGNKVLTAFNDYMTLGLHSVRLHTSGLPTGAYFCVLNNDGQMQTITVNILH